MRKLAIGLVHYPVLDKAGEEVTTSITNLDVHDIARSSFTFGVSPYFLIHPIAAQRELVLEVQKHWTEGSGAKRIPDRKPPLEQVRVVASVEEAVSELGEDAQIWVTSARALAHAISHSKAQQMIQAEGPPILLLFGTGWGLASSLTEREGIVQLEPIVSPRADGYNHLSVRAAVAILLDRLCGVPSRS